MIEVPEKSLSAVVIDSCALFAAKTLVPSNSGADANICLGSGDRLN